MTLNEYFRNTLRGFSALAELVVLFARRQHSTADDFGDEPYFNYCEIKQLLAEFRSVLMFSCFFACILASTLSLF